MRLSSIVASASLASYATAAQSICDKYTSALFPQNNAKYQQLLLTLVVNTAVIGNYSSSSTVAPGAPGILTPGTYNGEQVNLLPYFNGGLKSTNTGGKCGMSVNFLDGGGAAPLKQNKPAYTTNSLQYTLLTHLYEFFAALLGCSQYGNTVMRYNGDPGMYEVHKFMALDAAEVGYFIMNVGLSAASFGVSSQDVATVGSALQQYFGYRCLPPKSIPSFEPPELQSICTDCHCPKSSNCGAYGPVVEPKPKGSPSSWCGSKDWQHSRNWCGSGSHH